MTTEMAIALGLVVGVALSLALRHAAWVVAGLALDALRGWRRETWTPHR
jgi:hypothetical protein